MISNATNFGPTSPACGCIRAGIGDIAAARSGAAAAGRTARDLPLKFVGIGILLLLAHLPKRLQLAIGKRMARNAPQGDL